MGHAAPNYRLPPELTAEEKANARDAITSIGLRSGADIDDIMEALEMLGLR